MIALEDVELFWSKVTILGPDDCWPWTGPVQSKGYGIFKKKTASSIAYWLVKGLIPKGQIVRHTCDFRLCCNPHHLIVGTHQNNTDDMVQRGRSDFPKARGRKRLTNEQVKEIRTLAGTATHQVLADRFGTSDATISRILSNKQRKDQ